jgi:hypothetical protein
MLSIFCAGCNASPVEARDCRSTRSDAKPLRPARSQVGAHDHGRRARASPPERRSERGLAQAVLSLRGPGHGHRAPRRRLKHRLEQLVQEAVRLGPDRGCHDALAPGLGPRFPPAGSSSLTPPLAGSGAEGCAAARTQPLRGAGHGARRPLGSAVLAPRDRCRPSLAARWFEMLNCSLLRVTPVTSARAVLAT